MDRDWRKGKGAAWTREEDAKLTELCEAQDKRNWRAISSEIPGRSVAACRQRWINNLKPAIEHPFTDEENAIIVRANQEQGNKWERIASLLPGRTANVIRYHWTKNLYHLCSAPGSSQQAENLLPGESEGTSVSSSRTSELRLPGRSGDGGGSVTHEEEDK